MLDINSRGVWDMTHMFGLELHIPITTISNPPFSEKHVLGITTASPLLSTDVAFYRRKQTLGPSGSILIANRFSVRHSKEVGFSNVSRVAWFHFLFFLFFLRMHHYSTRAKVTLLSQLMVFLVLKCLRFIHLIVLQNTPSWNVRAWVALWVVLRMRAAEASERAVPLSGSRFTFLRTCPATVAASSSHTCTVVI